MVCAVCPNCHILLVEATSATMANLGTAVNTAVALGAKYVSNSYGGGESSADTSYDTSYFNHPGVAITVSSGDSGYGVEYPAASQYVTAVGGTSLTRNSGTARGWSETAWSGAGSGCSGYDAKPTWQKDTGCTQAHGRRRLRGGRPEHRRGGLRHVRRRPGLGGLRRHERRVADHRQRLRAGRRPVGGLVPGVVPVRPHPNGLNDVTSGSNGSCGGSYLCTAGPGYDGPTGLGTPNGVTAFQG